MTGVDINLDHVQMSDNFNFKSLRSNPIFDEKTHVCQYYEEDTCYQKFQNISEKSFTILSLNIRSLPGKWLEFNQFLSSTFGNFKPSIICLQEIWNISKYDNFVLDDYQPLSYSIRDPTGLNSNCGGGIGMFIHKSLSYEPLKELSTFIPHVYESQFVKIKTDKNKFAIIGNVYRPNSAPHANVKVAISHFQSTLDTIKFHPVYKKITDINIVGDFNIDLLKYHSHQDTTFYLDTLFEHSLLPIVSLPTRIGKKTATILDHIITSYPDDQYDVGIITSDISDHFPVFYTRQEKNNNFENENVKIRQINDKNKQYFYDLIRNHNWTNVILNYDANSAFANFFQFIDQCYEKAFPEKLIKTSKRQKNNSPWMTDGLLKSRNHKQKLFNKKLRKPCFENTEKFKCYNSIYTKLVRKARQQHYNDKFENFSRDCKKTWQTINELLSRRKCYKDLPDSFVSNGKILSGSAEIAEGFNDFFINIGPNLSKRIPPSNKDFSEYLDNPCSKNFVFANITPAIINEALSKLKSKNSSGHDKISSNMLKFIAPTVIQPLCHLFNLSFKTGFIPESLKTAMVKPIFKKGEQDSFTNYRPISLLSSFSKLLEKVAANQMMKYINKFKLLHEHQYGFRAGYNTTQPILHFLNKIFDSLNNPENHYSLAIFIDLTKAFDTCDIDILLYKLNHYGFHGISNQWFRSYLTGRKQFTTVRGVNSSLKELTCGVPQGSILGPLLFILLINDLPNATNFFSILYADDTTLQKSSSNLINLYSTANDELIKLADWFKANKLTLNVSKTKYILFRNDLKAIDFSKLQLMIENEKIDRIGQGCKEKSFKFVGIYLDEFLTWDQHANHVCGKAANAVYALSKLKHIIPVSVELTIYNSLFRSFIEYGICAWGRSNSNLINRLITLQKRAVRCIINAKYNAHTDPIFAKLGILKFKDLLDLNQICFVHKFISNKLPPSFDDFFVKLPNFNRNLSLSLTSVRNKKMRNFPSYAMPLIWNSLPLQTKRITSINTLKKNYAASLISKYTTKCNNANCFSCHN